MSGVMSSYMRTLLQKALDEYHDERSVGSLCASHIGGAICVPGAEPLDEGLLLGVRYELRGDNSVVVVLTIRPFDAENEVDIVCRPDIECVLSAKGVVLL